MHLELNTENNTLCISEDGQSRELPLYSTEGFELISKVWLKVGWNQKHSYSFSWYGRPIVQLPEDLLRMQEVIFSLQPDIIVETGVAHGGSLVFYATLFEALGKGRVIGVDIDIREHNRRAIEEHPMSKRIQLVEGSSIDDAVIQAVADHIPQNASVLVVLDSNHSKAHVTAELEAYHRFVTPGSYIVATDGVMELVHDVPRGNPAWLKDNPTAAAAEFAAAHPEFVLEQPTWAFNESDLNKNITYWPGAWLKRRSE